MLRRLDANFRNIRVQITSELSCILLFSARHMEGMKDRNVLSVLTFREKATLNDPLEGAHSSAAGGGGPCCSPLSAASNHRAVSWLSLQTLCWERG